MSSREVGLSPLPGRTRSALGIVYLTVFIDLMGFGIILPALPYYAERLGASGLWLGLLLTAYSFAQLLGAALLGRLSDRYGRRPLILLSLGGSAASLVLTGLAGSLISLASARALAGLFGGSISAAQAYIADVTRPSERARFMGFLGAATGLGFVLGPAIGALLAPFGFAAAAFAAAALAAGNLLFALARLPEPRSREDRVAGRVNASWAALARALGRPSLRPALTATFLTMLAFVGMETTLAYLGELRFDLNERSFGALLVLVGVVVIAVQGGLTGPVVRRWGERRVAAAGALLMAMTLALLPAAGTLVLAAAVLALLACGRALTLPTLSALLSLAAAEDEQGGVLGLGQSLSAAARAVGPILAGWLFDLDPRLPYGLAAAVSLIAALAANSGRVPLGREPV